MIAIQGWAAWQALLQAGFISVSHRRPEGIGRFVTIDLTVATPGRSSGRLEAATV